MVHRAVQVIQVVAVHEVPAVVVLVAVVIHQAVQDRVPAQVPVGATRKAKVGVTFLQISSGFESVEKNAII